MRVAIVTLGCDKNTVDNEYLAGMLEGAGCEVVTREDGRPLDAAVVTTCGFIAAAKEQSIDTIAQLAERKRETASPRRLFVAGCLAQRQSEELLARFPEIDGLVGVGQFKTLTEMIAAVASEPTTDAAPSGETRTNGENGSLQNADNAVQTGWEYAGGEPRSDLRFVVTGEQRDLLDSGRFFKFPTQLSASPRVAKKHSIGEINAFVARRSG